MQYKLLALDLDGTLLNSRGYMTGNTIRTIRNAIDNGLKVTLATGRPYVFAKEIAKILNIDVPLVSHDGAYVCDILSNKPVFVKRLDNTITKDIIEILIDNGLEFMVLHEDYGVTNARFGIKKFLRAFSIGKLKLLLVEKSYYRIMSSEDILKYVCESRLSPPKLFASGEHKNIEKAKIDMDKKLGNKVKVTMSAQGLEILPSGVSKAVGLEILAEILGINSDEVAAMGDSMNDLEMLEYAGLGIAMGNASEKVKKHAALVTDTNNEEGVARAIDRFLMK